ncbi:hypothetical protein SAMN02745121_04041 [Nannocystis exedens]|uniref:Uncharacterized protein n=1 Tax=Nannocystis exedens TaxID=54 RepID=A0A1I1ZZ09_9BACT|nr:hypothetical protein [Nannocystis exedens]PCC75236.1 WGR domain-containing protein [Nannocystis exedens]SFE36638.1 hypothetical protein SAMN02745121_04041 [Nannocystis exedens]
MKKTPPKSTIPAYGELTEKKLRSLGQKLDKLGDPNGFKHNNLLWKSADQAAPLLWHLVRHGLALQTVQSAGILRILGENTRDASASDIIAVLRRLPPDMGVLDKGQARTWATFTPGVLTAVNDLITAAYVVDPAAVLAVRDELPENLQLAIDFVRRRAGETISADASVKILRHLVAHHLEHGLAGHWDCPWIENGELVPWRLQSTAHVEELAARFGSSWAEEALAWILPRVKLFRERSGDISRNGLAGLRLAALSDVIYLFGNGWWYPESLFTVLDARADPPAALFAAALKLAEEGTAPFKIAVPQVKPEQPARSSDDDEDDEDGDDEYGDDDEFDAYGDVDDGSDEDPDDAIEEADGSEERVRLLATILTVVGVERAHAAGQAIPSEVDGRIDLDRVSENEAQLVTRLRGVMQILGPARTHAILRKTLAKEFWYGKAIAFLDVHFDPARVEEGLARVAAGNYVDAGLLGYCSPAIVPYAARAQARATAPDVKAGLGEGILYILARASAAGQTWDPALDEHVQLDQIRFSYGGSKVDPVLAFLDELPLERWVKIVTANRERCAGEPDRLVKVLRPDAPLELLDMVLGAVMAKPQAIGHGSLGGRLQAFGPELVAPLLRAIGDAPAENTFMKELERALAPAVFAAIKEGLGKAVETPEQELRRLAASVPGPKVRIYRLRRGEDEPAADAVARIGGTPRGVATPPVDRKEAMTHILTLDLAQLPELAARRPGVRSLSLYLPDPDTGERHRHGALVWTREEELGRAPGSTEDAATLLVEVFDVPAQIFAGGELTGAAKRVRRIVYGSPGYVGGGPLWLQDGDPGVDPDFLFQFDESLAHINLGDSGVMYVFAGDIDWQCH